MAMKLFLKCILLLVIAQLWQNLSTEHKKCLINNETVFICSIQERFLCYNYCHHN